MQQECNENQQDDEMIQKIEKAFQVCIRRIQLKKKIYDELKDKMDEKNLIINFFEKGEDGQRKTRRGNTRIQEGKIKKYQCKVCKKTYNKYQQLGGHLRIGHSQNQLSQDGFFQAQYQEP